MQIRASRSQIPVLLMLLNTATVTIFEWMIVAGGPHD